MMVKDGTWGIHEVYYHEDGQIHWFSAEPVVPQGESVEQLANDLQRQANALNYEALDFNRMEAMAQFHRESPSLAEPLSQLAPE
ncbi:MAG: hypothetical protein ACRCZF_17940 [Gemmataceae bacterium]